MDLGRTYPNYTQNSDRVQFLVWDDDYLIVAQEVKLEGVCWLEQAAQSKTTFSVIEERMCGVGGGVAPLF